MIETRIEGVVAPVERRDPRSTGEGMFTYIDLSSVDQNTKVISKPSTLSSADAPSRARQVVRAGDVLVSTVRPNLNAVAIVPPDLEGATASTGFCVLRPRADAIDGRYLFHWVRSPSFVREMTSRATGASYPAVSDKVVKTSRIPLPLRAQQQRVADILDGVDDLIAKRRHCLAELDRLARAVFFEMFGDPVLGEEYALSDLALPGRGTFTNGPFGSDLLTSELVDGGVPVIYIRDIRDGEYRRVSAAFVTEEKAKQLEACQVLPGDVLVAKVGDPPGTAALYPAPEPAAVVTQDVIRIRPNPKFVAPEFLVAYFNSPVGARVVARITVEATRSRFSLRDLKAVRVPVPSLEVQRRYALAFDAVLLQKAHQRLQLQNLAILLRSVQHWAFRGEA